MAYQLHVGVHREAAHTQAVHEVPLAQHGREHVRHFLRIEGVVGLRQSELLGLLATSLYSADVGHAPVQHLGPPPAMIVAAWSGALVNEHGAVVGLAAQALRGPLDSFRQQIAEALPPGYHLEQCVGRL